MWGPRGQREEVRVRLSAEATQKSFIIYTEAALYSVMNKVSFVAEWLCGVASGIKILSEAVGVRTSHELVKWSEQA